MVPSELMSMIDYERDKIDTVPFWLAVQEKIENSVAAKSKYPKAKRGFIDLH